jgi:hypothetical protein
MQMDTVAQWAEDVSCQEMLKAMAEECPLEWDRNGDYSPERVALYIPVLMDIKKQEWKWRRVPVLRPLSSVLTGQGVYLAQDGVVRLWVVPKPDGASEMAGWTREWVKRGPLQ